MEENYFAWPEVVSNGVILEEFFAKSSLTDIGTNIDFQKECSVTDMRTNIDEHRFSSNVLTNLVEHRVPH